MIYDRRSTKNITAQLSLQQSIISSLKSGTLIAKGVEGPLPVEFLLWYRDNLSVINEYHEKWLTVWNNKKRGYMIRELRRRLNQAAYEAQIAEDRNRGQYPPTYLSPHRECNPIYFIDFYRKNPDLPREILETVRADVEQQKYSYFMPNIIFAFRTIGDKKLTINYLTKKVEPRIQSFGYGANWWEKSLIREQALYF